jgi:O-antigen ligase
MGGVLGLISIVILFLFFQKNVAKDKKIFIFISLFPILLVMYIASPATLKLRIQDKLNVVQNEDFSSWGTGRGAIWQAALEVIKENPVLGVGMGNGTYEIARALRYRKKQRAAHNTFLAITTEFGIVGFIFFIILIGLILKSISRKLKRPPPIMDNNLSYLGSAIYISLLVYLVQAMFLTMQQSKYLWFLLGFAASFANMTINPQQTNKDIQ